jgi:Mg-chelatase subunit ChlD
MALLRLNQEGRLCRTSTLGTEEISFRPALKDVLLLLDTSGSMAGEKITEAKHGAMDFACSANLQGCAIGLAVFGDEAAVIAAPTVKAGSFEKSVREVEVGMVGGSTNLAAGLELAASFSRLDAVVVVTDGVPNSHREALRAAERLKRCGIEILCIGTGDADTAFLAKLATRADLARHAEPHELRQFIGQASRLLLGTGR